ncbi:MAG: ParB N-terminal domain-containing protein [Selenomonadaceae bacterium]|nr:ParB N-terminal domain-containing protein [Selenomonadaceae bacterium]
MKEHNSGLGSFLNEVTQTSEKNLPEEKITYIDIDDLESNPKNFYGLRDVEALAGLIAVSHLIEPLTVSKKDDGKYIIISGHRRRAAVQKLLEDGVYNERKLPCIIKSRTKIQIEQENGETIEFDEDAVEMLNLIASNRGQREERTIDEKLQEVKYLEKFAKAIYNHKDRGTRGRFRNFFAEEILNISKSQLQRINSLEKLTENVKKAIDDKKLSESAAIEMTNMSSEEQEKCLEKILSGEIKGTIQDIQAQKMTEVEDADSFSEENSDVTSEQDSHVEKNEEKTETENQVPDSESKLTYPKNLLPEKNSTAEIKVAVGTIIDVPEEFGDPQKEAEDWFSRSRMASYESLYEEAKRFSEEETDELKAAQWGIRASVALYHIEELKIQQNN